MNIWEIMGNNGYNNAFLIDENGKICYENGSDFLEYQPKPYVRDLLIETHKKGFPDIMNYFGASGSCVVSPKVKALIESEFGELSLQFLPCRSEQFPNVRMWILTIFEYHDVFDVNNSVYRTRKTQKGEDKITYINKFAFTKKAFELDMFKIYVNNYKSSVHLFVSDRFKAIMEENGVTGLALEKVYSI